MATDPLYQLYTDHYRELEERFPNIRDIYGVATLADAGIPLMERSQFEEHMKTIDIERAGNWLARMLRGQKHRWFAIEPALRHLRPDVEQLRAEAIGPFRTAG